MNCAAGGSTIGHCAIQSVYVLNTSKKKAAMTKHDEYMKKVSPGRRSKIEARAQGLIAEEMDAAYDENERKTKLLRRITVEPGKCGGRPCIRGMRIRVVDVLELLSSGLDCAEILIDYPDLEHEDILACLAFAVQAIKSKE